MAAPSEEEVVGGVRPFLVERFFAKHEFSSEYILGASDAETWSVKELLELAAKEGDDKAAQEWENMTLGYTESAGHPELRSAVAQLFGEPIKSDNVICIVPEEGIFITMSTLLKPDDVVIAMKPAYQSLYEIARGKGCKIRNWEAQYRENGWMFDVDDLEKIFKEEPSAKMLVANFPHNPTSWMPSLEEHSRVVELCRQREMYLFSDEMYWGMALQKEPLPKSSALRYEKSIVLGGLSKPYGLPGLRIGWLVTRDNSAMAKFAQMKDYVTICGSAPSEILALIGLRHGQKLIERAWRVTNENRQHLKEFCEEFSDVLEYKPEPSKGLTMFVVLKGWAAEMGSEGFADWCVEAGSCVLVPSSCFEISTPAVRVGLGRLNFKEGLARLGDCFRKRAAK